MGLSIPPSDEEHNERKPADKPEASEGGETPSSKGLGQDEREVHQPLKSKIDLELPGGQLKLEVLDGAGAPSPGATLFCIFGMFNEALTQGPSQFLVSDGNGRALLDHSGVGYATVFARAAEGPGISRTHVFTLEPGRSPEAAVLRLDQVYPCTLDVSIVDQYGLSVRPVAIRLSPDFNSSVGARYMNRLDGDDAISMADLEIGRYTLSLGKVLSGGISLYDASTVESLAIELNGGLQEVTIEVITLSGMRLRLVGLKSSQWVGLEFKRGLGEWYQARSLCLLGGDKITTCTILNEDGDYGIGGLEPGIYSIRAKVLASEETSEEIIEVREGVELVQGRVSEISLNLARD